MYTLLCTLVFFMALPHDDCCHPFAQGMAALDGWYGKSLGESADVFMWSQAHRNKSPFSGCRGTKNPPY